MSKKSIINKLPTGKKSSFEYNPFKKLKKLIGHADLTPAMPVQKAVPRDNDTMPDPPSDKEIFLTAMEGVNPIERDKVVRRIEKQCGKPLSRSDNEELSSLLRLVKCGEGFIVSDTPEYIEGTGYNVREEYARRLHQGDFSIQDHIDLHGMNVENAKEAFESFMKNALISGKRTVLIIHGRGLSSRGEPILKNKVREWLNQSYWLKRVLAYASAQSYDGGAGATYVLLRSRPFRRNTQR
ncbi:MAG: Smr/MutS family protein [Smithella sp.]